MKSVFDFDKNFTISASGAKDLLWRDAKDPVFGGSGSVALGEAGFPRLTKAERDYIRTVNEGEAWLGEQSSGIQMRFETDSAQIFVRVKLRSKYDMTNLTQIGECGLDLYVWDDALNDYGLIEVARYYPMDATEYELSLGRFDNSPRKLRKYILNLPLYMAVDDLQIGLDSDAAVRAVPYGNKTRVGIYGTSIVQGCGASRPGLSPANVLSRRLDEEVFNFGFSGCAMMEKEMGEVLGDRKLDLLIVDVEPNAGVDRRMQDNFEPFFEAYFARCPQVPVIVYSRILFALDLYDPRRREMAVYYREFLRTEVKKYRRMGYDIHFVDGGKLFTEPTKTFRGNYTEYTLDGIHPNDVGMMLLTESYERAIRRVRADRAENADN